MTCGVKLRWRRETCKPETKPWPVDTLMAKCSAEASPSGTVPGMSSPCVLFRMPNVSIHSRPIRRLTEAADGQGSCALPLPEGRGYEKGFHRLRRLVNHFFPLKGEVSNHKGIFDESSLSLPTKVSSPEHHEQVAAWTAQTPQSGGCHQSEGRDESSLPFCVGCVRAFAYVSIHSRPIRRLTEAAGGEGGVRIVLP